MEKIKLPFATKEYPGIDGKIKKKPEHFVVEEIPIYEPCGKGDHLYINLTKKNLTSKEIQKKLTQLFNLSEVCIGFAGMKDKHAVTTQTYSIKFGIIDDKFTKEVVKTIEKNIPIKVNWAKLHNNKIKAGHLLGNKFKIIISEIKIPIDEALEISREIVNKIKKTGIPNFYGPQRFGFDGDNWKRGLSIIKGELKTRDLWSKRFLISSYQSYLCNVYLAKRVESGNFEKILKGDIAKKYDTGGLFVVKDKEAEQKRYDNHEISFTGPIYGPEMWEAEDESGKFEKEILKDSGVTIEDIKKAGSNGTRRLGRLLVDDIKIKKVREGLQLEFFLPKGAFATNVLREIIKSEEF